MSKEIISLLEDYCKWCNAQGGQCQLSLDGCAAGEALVLLQEQPPASEFTTLTRKRCSGKTYDISQSEVDWLFEQLFKLCDRLDASEASRKELLAACEAAFNESHNPKVEKILEAAIKANK